MRVKCAPALAVVFGVVTAAAAEVRYSVTMLGRSDPGPQQTLAINDLGQVAGTLYSNSGADSAFLYSNGAFTNLGSLLPGQSLAVGINNNGQVIGSAGLGTGSAPYAFLYDNGSITNLTAMTASDPNGPLLAVSAINDQGQIAGEGRAPFPNDHAVLLAHGVLSDLGTLGGNSSSAGALNNAGQVVGGAAINLVNTAGAGNYHAFLYDGALHDLGTLTGVSSRATAINNRGQIAGFYIDPDTQLSPGALHAFLYSNGVMTPLGALGGGSVTEALGINDLGQVVGGTGTGAFLYQDGVMTDLNTLIDPIPGFGLGEAYGINNAGQIVAVGYKQRDGYYSVLLTPVPEPASLWPTALLTLVATQRKRARPTTR